MATSISPGATGNPSDPGKHPGTRARTSDASYPTDSVARLAAGLALILAPLGLFVANTSYAWATRNGGSDDTGASALALAGQHPGLLRLALTAALIGSLLLVPAVLGAMRLIGRRAAWLSLTGGSLMIAGYICYLGVLALSAPVLAMASADGPAALFSKVIDDTQADASTTCMFLLFVIGNLAGTFLLGLALLRSHAVAAWAAAAIMAWPVLHITGLAAGTEWFEVAGAALQAGGLAATGIAVLRRNGGWAMAPQVGLTAEPG
jgi:hypothetical protein